jgi:glycosyltransferase involved in cell wall biosynthesis
VALVHTHSSVDSWLATLAARAVRVPVVRSRHVSIPVRRRRALVYRLAHRVLTSSEGIATALARAGVDPARIVAMPPGVDLQAFHPGVSGASVRRELGLTGPAVGIVADLRSSKGHRYLLEAAPAILAAVPGTRFLIVGDGVGRADIRGRIEALGLARHVLMTGFRRDVPEVLAALDVLALPSIRSEATSQVLLQALSVGTPVVATTVGGSPEVIRDGETGLLVPPADPARLAGAIIALLADPDRARAMARAGQAAVRERYSLDAVMARTAGVYRDLLGGVSAADAARSALAGQ